MDTEDKVSVAYDMAEEIKKFHETKSGVQGLVDSGIVEIPHLFVHSSKDLLQEPERNKDCFDIPIIDLQGVDGERRKVIVEEIQRASESWGIFQMVNHGIPISVLDEIFEGVRTFHEQPTEEKQKMYSYDLSRKVGFSSNGDVSITGAADWRDSLNWNFREDHLDPEELPPVCREIIIKYVKYTIKLRDILSEILSEALGLSPDYLKSIECMENEAWLGHYYPTCPQPDRTLGATKHADPNILTILLQDQIGGLQVLYQNQWVDVTPKKGAMIANIGDFLQLITNDKFKSVDHRVLASSTGPRISVATFFFPNLTESKVYGPIKELLSEDNPSKYRETLAKEYFAFYTTKGTRGKSNLPHFEL